MRNINAFSFQKILQHLAVTANNPGMRTRDAGAGKRHALVESFAADVKRTAVCRYSFAAAQEMRHLIYIVNIE